jgi:DNA end-binding protein Ku
VGKVVLRDREDIVLLAPQDGGILLYRLRYPREVRSMGDVPLVDGDLAADKDQLRLAKSLIDSMTTTMGRIELKDQYGDALREMIEAKVEGKEIITVEEEPQPIVDIMTALKESIEQAAAKKKPMVKATGKRTKEEEEAGSASEEARRPAGGTRARKGKTG